MPSLSRAYCFTWNNYTAQVEDRLRDIGGSPVCSYLLYGRELAPTTGTAHLQGYIVFSSRRRFAVVAAQLAGAHVQVARGSVLQNQDYCKKDEDYVEYGAVPDDLGQGKRTDIERYIEWCENYEGWPAERVVMLTWPNLWVRYSSACLDFREQLCTRPALEAGQFNEWQSTLAERIEVEPTNDRAIEFYVDPTGGAGKSWFIRKMLTTNVGVQMLSIGKRDDLAYAIDVSKRIFLISVPRLQMEYLNYSVLEMIKDRLIFSPKYKSNLKQLEHNPHVIVFCNEAPDYTKLTDDRYEVTNLS